MPVVTGEGVKQDKADKVLARAASELLPGEEWLYYGKCNNLKPMVDSIAFTNARVLAFHSSDGRVRFAALYNDVATTDFDEKRGTVEVLTSQGTAMKFKAVHKKDVPKVREYLRDGMETGVPTDIAAAIADKARGYEEARQRLEQDRAARKQLLTEQVQPHEAARVEKAFAKWEAEGLRPDIVAAAAKMQWTLGGGREIKRLHEHLMDGESVEIIAQGTYVEDQGIIVLTDRRLLFVFHGVVRTRVEDFPMRVINSVQSKGGFATGDLTIYASGNTAVIKDVVKSDLATLTDAVRNKIAAGGTTSASSPTPAAMDPVEQIRKLADLRAAGVLTDEEFASKKAELLDRL